MKHLSRLIAPLFLVLSFNAFAVDSDGDGLDDSVETNTGTFVSASDTGTNPNVVDSDNDGFSDGAEVAFGTDPNAITQSPFDQKLTASDGAEFDFFGQSVSVSGDTAVIGASLSGSAYVYLRSNGVWTEQQKIAASDASENDDFGRSVSISGDTVVIGSNNNGAGSAYVYVRSDSVWTEQQKLTASDAAGGDQFGASVSISGDTAVIGAYRDEDNGTDSGSAYVYVRSNGVWSEQQKLTASDGDSEDWFGTSVSISGDTAVIGASYDEDNGSGSGSAYVYVRSNGVWSEQQKITASDGAANDFFGYSVSISGDTAVIGANQDDDNGADSGSAYVYVRSNGLWTEQQKLAAGDGAQDDWFGFSVSISGDKVVVGARGDNNFTGSAYVYVRINGVWTQQQKLTASDAAEYDDFGFSVSISGDTVVVGARGDDDLTGSAYGYALAPPFQDTPAVITGVLEGSTTQGGFTFGTLLATDIDGLADGAYFSVSTAPLYGQAIINPSTGLWTYLAEAIYVGADPFTVTVTDDLGGTTEQVIAITAIGIDTDSDTIYDYQDNCPLIPNTNQSDFDGDTLGDVCDPDMDGDGTDNEFDAFPLDPSETTDTDSDTVGDNSDNCVNDANTNQLNIDGDSLGDVCDPDMDGDGVANAIELYFGGDETNSGDAAISQANILALSETAQQDADYDGVPDEYETAVGGNATSSTYGEVLNMLTLIGKNVPAMGGIGLFVMFSSLIGLGFLKRKKKY